MKTSLRISALLLLLCGDHAALANPWAGVPGPAAGPARAIGDTSAGCIRGARTLPTEGEGYVVMHLERDRYYGHPSLISSIRALGERAAQGLGIMHVGDLGMARGGPMPFGHRSHQTGLDADVWFDMSPSLHLGANSNRSNVSAYSLLSQSEGLNYRLWSDNHAQMLKAAASQPAVDRIFVNARIKQELCRSTRGDRSWLRKIRPWYHHEDHFHMRLACPPDSPSCARQEPIPPGDGCDNLDWWFNKTPDSNTTPKAPPPPKPVMPSECRAVLSDY